MADFIFRASPDSARVQRLIRGTRARIMLRARAPDGNLLGKECARVARLIGHISQSKALDGRPGP